MYAHLSSTVAKVAPQREQADEGLSSVLNLFSSERDVPKASLELPQSHCSELLCVSSPALAADKEHELSLLKLTQLRKQLYSITAPVN